MIEPFGPVINCPYGIAYHPDDNLYVSSLFDDVVHRVALDGTDLGTLVGGTSTDPRMLRLGDQARSTS